MEGWVHHTGVEGLSKYSLNNLICHKLGVLSFLLKNYCHLLSEQYGRMHGFLW